MKRISVSAAIFEKDNKVLIARRKEGKSMALHWEFSGGKIEEGESPEAALKREIQEEMNVNITVQSHFATHVHQYADFEIELICFKVTTTETFDGSTDHYQFEWIAPKDYDLYQIAPADVPIIEQL